MRFDPSEIGEVLEMLLFRELDIRAVTLSVNTLPAIRPAVGDTLAALEEALESLLKRLRPAVELVASRLGVRIVTVRLAVSPVSIMLKPIGKAEAAVEIAKHLDGLAEKHGVDMVGGFSAFVHAGVSRGDAALMEALPEALNSTRRLAGFLNVASTATGVNMDAVRAAAEAVLKMEPHAAARFAATANIPEDVPFMPGAYHGLGLPDAVVNIIVSGPRRNRGGGAEHAQRRRENATRRHQESRLQDHAPRRARWAGGSQRAGGPLRLCRSQRGPPRWETP